jgi:Mce-associated membrane protein
VATSVALLAALFYLEYRPDKQTDTETKQSVLAAAKADTIGLLSYSPDTFDQDFKAAKSLLTGDFLTYYAQFGEQVLRPAATQKGVKTSAVVPRAAVSELHPASAVVLEYINQTTMTKEKPQPAATASSVLVKLAKIDGRWLISSFDPTPI